MQRRWKLTGLAVPQKRVFFRFEIRFFIEQSHHFLYLVTFFYCFIVVCVRQFRIHKHICSVSWLFRWFFFWIFFVLSIVSMPCIIISHSPSALLCFTLFFVHIAYYLRLNSSQSDMFFSLFLSFYLSFSSLAAPI